MNRLGNGAGRSGSESGDRRSSGGSRPRSGSDRRAAGGDRRASSGGDRRSFGSDRGAFGGDRGASGEGRWGGRDNRDGGRSGDDRSQAGPRGGRAARDGKPRTSWTDGGKPRTSWTGGGKPRSGRADDARSRYSAADGGRSRYSADSEGAGNTAGGSARGGSGLRAGDVRSARGDARSTRGDAKSARGDARAARSAAPAGRGPLAGGRVGGAQRRDRAAVPSKAVRRPANRPATNTPPDVHVAGGVRLQKVLASAGFGSRRACENLITGGHVEVDGVPVLELGLRVDPERAIIRVDGMRVQLDADKITVAINKPRGVVSTMHDPRGRPTVAEYVKSHPERLFHVGRLDTDTEGLLLLTNDGDLANRLAHPSHEIPKTYVATVRGRVDRDLGRKLRAGIELEDGTIAVDSFRVIDAAGSETMVEVVLHSGRNRIVRRLLDAVGCPVVRLVRTRVGPIALGTLRPGGSRVLGRDEVGALMSAVGM